MSMDAPEHVRSRLITDYQAAEASIEIVRLASRQDHTVIAARFADESGGRRRAMLGVRQVEGTWRGTGGFSEGEPSSDGPGRAWSSGGWSSGREIVLGFWVGVPDAATLRLIDQAGRVHEEDVERGVAIFMLDGDAHREPARVELMDAQGDLIAAGPVWPAPDFTG